MTATRRNRSGLGLLAVALALAACRPRGSAPAPRAPAVLVATADGAPAVSPAPTRVTASVDARAPQVRALVAHLDAGGTAFRSDRDVRLRITVTNQGAVPAEIDVDRLSTAIFGVDVFDAQERRVPTIPPGLPPPGYRPDRTSLAAGASRQIECQFAVFSPSLPPGRYTVRLRDPSIEADAIQFTIAP